MDERYKVVNVFCSSSQEEASERINKIVHSLRKLWVNSQSKFHSRNTVDYTNSRVCIESYNVQYFFLSNEKANYSVMAAKAADYYKNKYKLQQLETNSHTLNVNTVGAVKSTDNILGFPVERAKPITTFKDCKKILGLLKNGGVGEMRLLYDGFWSGGIYDLYPLEASFDKALGNFEDYLELLSYANKSSVSVIAKFDLINIYRTSVEFLKTGYGVSGVSGAIKKFDNEIQLSTGFPDEKSIGKYDQYSLCRLLLCQERLCFCLKATVLL